MALTEFAAMEAAYRALVGLDGAARSRALAWLAGALSEQAPLPGVDDAAVNAGSEGDANVGRQEDSAATSTAPAQERSRPTPRKPRSGARVKPAGKPLTARGRGDASAAPASKKGGRRKTAGEPAAGSDSARAYRRMPATDDVVAAYRQVGSVSGVAEHFEVPRHTAQNWISRLRRQGHLPVA